MRILIAPQAFKGTATAVDVAKAMAAGFHRALPTADIRQMPLSDGGDGFLDVVLSYLDGERRESQVLDPWGEPIKAAWGGVDGGKTAIIEAAQVVGWARAGGNRLNPMTASSYGLGQLIEEALKLNCRKLVIGIGGTATNDGGAGMAQALGCRFRDKEGEELGRGGGPLQNLKHLDMENLDPRLKECEVVCACDVSTLLLGRAGATELFGPQKGATKEMLPQLEKGLATLSHVIFTDTGRTVSDLEGSGAGGGLGAGFAAFLGARLVSGIRWILVELELEEELERCDVVITGEGCLDGQTLFHKGPVGLARAARRHGVPVVALVGSVEREYKTVHQEGIQTVAVVFPARGGAYTLSDRIEDSAEELAYALALNVRQKVAAGKK